MGRILIIILIIVALLLVLAAGGLFTFSRVQLMNAQAKWRQLETPTDQPAVFEPTMIAALPEIAQRYFTHAIATGTLLRTKVEIDMSGVFLLDNNGTIMTYEMKARQLLAAPYQFVWLPTFRAGAMRISGADDYVDDVGSTKFWLLNLIPLVQSADTPDINRSASARPLLETIWAPAALLPQYGATWTPTGPNSAEVAFQDDPYDTRLQLVMDETGRLTEVYAMRWSNQNPAGIFQLQPFGGTVTAETTFDGFTIPSAVNVGTHYGTPAFFPFFQATITNATYR